VQRSQDGLDVNQTNVHCKRWKGGKKKKQANKQAKKTERYSPKWRQGHRLSELIPPAQEDDEEEKQWLPEKLRAKFRDRKK